MNANVSLLCLLHFECFFHPCQLFILSDGFNGKTKVRYGLSAHVSNPQRSPLPWLHIGDDSLICSLWPHDIWCLCRHSGLHANWVVYSSGKCSYGLPSPILYDLHIIQKSMSWFGQSFIILWFFQIGQATRGLMKRVGFWDSIKELGRAYEYVMGLVIFAPIAMLSWFPFVSEFQTRLLFNQAFSRGLQISRILAGRKDSNASSNWCI